MYYIFFFFLRIDQFVRTCDHVRALLCNIDKDKQTLVEEIRDSITADTIRNDIVSLPSIAVDKGLRFSEMASVDIRPSKSFYDRIIR